MLSGITVIAWTALRSPAIQTVVARQIIKTISENIGANITIGRIRYGINKNLVIRDLLIEDEQNDTLIYIPRFEAQIYDLNLNDKFIKLASVQIRNLYGDIYQFNDSIYNFSFISNNLKSDNSKPFAWNIECDKFTLTDSKFLFKNFKGEKHRINKLEFHAENIIADSTGQQITINKFKSNLDGKSLLKNLELKLNFQKNRLMLTDLVCNLKNSSLILPSGFITLTKLNEKPNIAFAGTITSAKINLSDLALFIPHLKNIDSKIALSGSVAGDNNHFSSSNLKLNLGNSSTLNCNIQLENLQSLEKLIYDIDIKNLYSTTDDVKLIASQLLSENLNLPEELNNVTDFSYQGTIKGSFNELFGKGQLLSKIGEINTNLTIKRSATDDKLQINGNIRAQNLYPSNLLNSDAIKEISFDINTKGYISKSLGPNLDLNGHIKSIQLKEYTIDSINLTGKFKNDQFEGKISSYDPNLRFDFDGLIALDTIPTYDFYLTLYSANLHNLNLVKNDSTANLSFEMKADFTGNDFNNSTGEILFSDIFYFKDTSYFATDSVFIGSYPSSEGRKLHLYSEYVEADFDGNFNSLTLYRSFKTIINHYLPSLGFLPSKTENTNTISFTLLATYPHPITQAIFPDIKIAAGTRLSGNFNANTRAFNVTCETDQIDLWNRSLKNLHLKSFTQNNKLQINISTNEFSYTENNSLKNFNISSSIFSDSIETNFNWNNWLDLNYSGNINTLISLSKKNIRHTPSLKLDIFPSNIIVLDTLWYLSKGYIIYDSNTYTLHNLKIDNGISKWNLDGILSDNPNDSIVLTLEEVSLEHLNVLLKNDNLIFGGTVTGSTLIKDLKGEQRINSDFYIEDLSLNGKTIGNTTLSTKWNTLEKKILVNSISKLNNFETFKFNGYISPKEKTIDIYTYFNNQSLNAVEPFLQPTIDNFTGGINGKIRVHGELKNPYWTGKVFIDNSNLLVTPTNVEYGFSDTVYFAEHNIIFKNISIFDKENNSLKLNGTVSHIEFSDFFMDLRLKTNRILAINLKSSDNPYYYGKIYGSGDAVLKAVGSNIDIDIAAKTEGPSYINIPLEGKGDIEDNDFIEFVNPYEILQDAAKKAQEKQEARTSSLQDDGVTNIRIDLDVTPDLEVKIIFDPKIGDMLRANGVSKLTIESLGPNFNMYGDYTITKGDFMFTLQNVINKRLDIQQGSKVNWTGHPLDANINLDAVYKVRKASVYDLTLDETDKEKRIEVNTHLLMTGKLVNPNINFTIDVPSATHEEAIDQINSLPEEDLNKQVLSLLLVNRFTALTTYQTGIANNTTGNLTSTTASELLSNQLSNWMSQISNDFDLGFVYRPGDANSEQEVEFAMSTNLLNDRIILNGNFGYSKNQQLLTNNPYTTDFQIEYKLNDKGNIRLRAFQKPNNDITYSNSLYTQGVGVFYTDEFDTFNELMQRIFLKNSALKPEDTEIINEDN